MTELFLKIVNMSISASWLVLVVLALRLVFQKVPKWVNVLLWGIVAVRLICPFSIESGLSLIPSAETISPDIMMAANPTIQTGIPAVNSVVNPVISDAFAPEPVASANPLQIWIPVLATIWAVGVAVFLMYTAVSYWHLRKKVDTAVILRDNIFQSENIGSPFVLGIFKPRIYLPYNMDGQDLSHVVAHEQAHIRRRDHWWKPLGFLLLTIHWFNPLMWLAYVLLCRDIELACDEKVIKELDNEQRADYTQALVACSVNRRTIAACPLAFGEVGVTERVKSVMNYKKPAFWIVLVSVVACIAVAACFLTNPKAQETREISDLLIAGTKWQYQITGDSDFPVDASFTVREDTSIVGTIKREEEITDFCIMYRVRGAAGWAEFYGCTPEVRQESDSEEYLLFTAAFHAENGKLVFRMTDGHGLSYFGAREVTFAQVTGKDSITRATKWFDYLAAPDEMDWSGRLEINLPEFPEVTFRWYPEKIEAVTENQITPLYSGMPIWNTYFCELTGDGLSELCSTLSYGSGMIDNRIIVYDYANGASYTLEDRGNYDYTLRLNDSDGQLYADKNLYHSEEKVSTGRLQIANGFLKIDEQEATADPLDAAISSAILDHYASSQPDGLIHVESHVLLANEGMSGTPLFGSDNHMEKITAYLFVLQQKYSTYGGKLEEVGGSYVPAAITFKISDTGEYILEEYWEPRDGGYYVDDVRDKFPGSSADDALNDQAYIEDLEAQNYSKALAYMNSAGSLDTRIAELLDEICASPGTFASEPEKYLEAHESEYQELLGYGEFTLRYCFDQFLMGNQTDLREYIMARACEDISLSWGEAILIDGPAPTTGQAWFDAFCSNAESLAGQLSEEELEKQHPATWLLLRMISDGSLKRN